MPSIEITAEQASALARGENIAVEAPKPVKKYIAVFPNTGNIYEFSTDKEIETGSLKFQALSLIEAKLVRKGTHVQHVGRTQKSLYGEGIVHQVAN